MNTVYELVTVVPFSLLAVMLFGRYAGIPEDSAAAYLLFTAGMILLHRMQRKNRLRSIGIVAVFLAGVLLAAGRETRRYLLTEYFWVIRVFGLSAAAMLPGILMQRSIRLRRAAAAAPALWCAVGTALGREIGRGVFAVTCFLLLIRLAEEVQLRWKKSGCPDMREHIARTAPFFLAVSLAVRAAPAPAQPYDWKFVKEFCRSTADFVTRLVGTLTHPEDDYAKTGFSDSGSFSAGLLSSSEEVLIIRDNTVLPGYKLVGCISGEFTGREWVFNTERESCTRLLDTMETVSAVRKYAPSARSDYLQKADLRCETRFYNTRYIFAPAKIKLEETKSQNDVLSERNGSILSRDQFHYKDEYRVSCFVLNYANPELAGLFSSAEPLTEAEWDESAAAESAYHKPGCSFADYQAYRQEIYEKYCRPRGVTERTAALLAQIESKSATRYEAAKMLEAYLGSMEYSTDCGALPDSVTDAGSFLDYLLFTSRRGYCMHFATAFVLAAQEMGIPCRYVQGYSTGRNADDSITVLQSNAHAWPEVYFDHVGWVAFEPTPGYSVPAGWAVHSGSQGQYRWEQTVPDIGIPQQEQEEPSAAAESETKRPGLSVFIIPPLAVLGFLLLFYAISRLAARRSYGRMTLPDRFRYLAQQNFRCLGYLGCRMQADETLSEYLDRIMRSDRQEIKAQLGFIPVLEALLYSDRTVGEAELHSAEQIHRTLREMVKKSRLKNRLLLLICRQ